MGKSKLPAIQFYPGDWRKDVGVQSLSFHDRGVWFEMLMLMHESSVRGKLLLGGKAATDEVIARVLRIELADFQKTVATLIERGVTEREKKTGAIINRRMIRDENSRAENRKRLKNWRKENKLNGNGNADETPMKRPPSSSSSSSSSSSTSVSNTPLPPREDFVFDHDMVATSVMAETSSGGMKLRMLLSEIALNAIAAGETGEGVRDLIVGQWNAYLAAMAKLEWNYGSLETFLGGGMWRDPKLWPWKEGHGPPKPKSTIDPLAEMKAQRAAAERERGNPA